MLKAYLSGLGVMGRRHLKGLVRAGFAVYVSDPNPAVFDVARAELIEAMLPVETLIPVNLPPSTVTVAIFSETASDRLDNFRRFLATAKADRLLLEKPLSADPSEFANFLNLAREQDVADRIEVNFIRRVWAHVQKLANMCASEREFLVTLNGGAVGLGCMGIHYLDMFLYLLGDEMPTVRWVHLSPEVVKSGRGQQFEDFGGEFVLEGPRGRLLASLAAGSSTNVVMTIRGEHFMAQVDYGEMYWKISRRKVASAMPLYRYGADHEVIEEGKLEIPTMDYLTEIWALGGIRLPSLEHALRPHHLLNNLLQAGGAKPPYRFT
jgi:predicted dehydrogenase